MKQMTKEEIDIKKHSYLNLSDEYKTNKDLVSAFIELDYHNIKHVSPSLKFYKEMVIKAININKNAYFDIKSKVLKENDDVVEALLKKDCKFYNFMPMVAKNKEKNIIKLITLDSSAYSMIPKDKKFDINFVKEVLKLKPTIYHMIERVFKVNKEVLEIVINKNSNMYRVLEENIRVSKGYADITELALSLNSENINYASYERKMDVNSWIKAYSEEKAVLVKKIPIEIINDEKLVEAAIKSNDLLIVDLINQKNIELYKFEIFDALPKFLGKQKNSYNFPYEDNKILWSFLNKISLTKEGEKLFKTYGSTFIEAKIHLIDTYGEKLLEVITSSLEKDYMNKILENKENPKEKPLPRKIKF